MTRLEVIECIVCHQNALKKSFNQKYCPKCSAVADLQRKLRWAKKNCKYDPARGQRWNEARENARQERAFVSDDQRTSIFGSPAPDIYLSHRISIPFTTALLKNHAWSMNRKYGHIFLRGETRTAMEAVIYQLKLNPVQWKQNKVWIDLFIQKPDHRSGDAINMVDRICDAVKVAINIDDRWFSIRRVDWEIVKKDPMIFIGISQENVEDSRVCSICGLILPFSSFQKAKTIKFGIKRECVDCIAHINKRMRKTPVAEIEQI